MYSANVIELVRYSASVFVAVSLIMRSLAKLGMGNLCYLRQMVRAVALHPSKNS